MYAILLSALWSALGFLVRSVLVKFIVFFGLFFVTSEFVPILAGLLPTGDAGIPALFAAIPAEVWYFLNLFQVPAGVTAVVSAYATRFIIRRIPVIG